MASTWIGDSKPPLHTLVVHPSPVSLDSATPVMQPQRAVNTVIRSSPCPSYPRKCWIDQQAIQPFAGGGLLAYIHHPGCPDKSPPCPTRRPPRLCLCILYMASTAAAAGAAAPPLAKQAAQRLNAGVVRALRVSTCNADVPSQSVHPPTPITDPPTTTQGLPPPRTDRRAGQQAHAGRSCI